MIDMISPERTRDVFLIISMTIAILFICGYVNYIPITKNDYVSIATLVSSVYTILVIAFCLCSVYYYKKINLVVILVFVFISASACCVMGLIRWAPQYEKYFITEPLVSSINNSINKIGEKDFSCCGLAKLSSSDPMCKNRSTCILILKSRYYLLQEISAVIMLLIGALQLLNFFVIIFTSKISPASKRKFDNIRDRVVILDNEGQQIGSSSIDSSVSGKASERDRDHHINTVPTSPEVIYPDVISEISGITDSTDRFNRHDNIV